MHDDHIYEEEACKHEIFGWCPKCVVEKQGKVVGEVVDHPDHYNPGQFEAIKIIEAYDLNFCLGNVIKYVLRAARKGGREQDLKKALWYLKRELGLRDE